MGVVTHSQPNHNHLVVSAYQADRLELANAARDKDLRQMLAMLDVPFVRLEGCYKGTTERSVLVPDNGANRALIAGAAREYRQECYMRLENHKHGLQKAYFVDTKTGRESFQGYLRSMELEEVKRLGLDYSYRPDIGKSWVILPTDETRLDAFAAWCEANLAKGEA